MMRADALHRLADVAAVLVEETDLAGALVRIVAEATAAAGADAGGLLVLNSADELELLSATSHRASRRGRSGPASDRASPAWRRSAPCPQRRWRLPRCGRSSPSR
jgi:hypothetical protein